MRALWPSGRLQCVAGDDVFPCTQSIQTVSVNAVIEVGIIFIKTRLLLVADPLQVESVSRVCPV